jgi:hypothetical protein
MKPTSKAVTPRRAAVILVTTCLSAVAWAQPAVRQAGKENQQRMQAIAESTKQNAQLLKQYSWTMRTEIEQKGEVKGIRLDHVRFDIDGKPQRTALTAPPEKAEAPGIRPRPKRRRQERIDNKVEDKQEYLQQLISLSNLYLTPSQPSIHKLFQTGQFWQGTGPTNPVIRIEVSNLVKPGDALTLTIDPQTKKPRQARIETNLDGDPMSVVADYRVLPNGPSYVARTVIQAPEAQMQIKIENFDYVRQGAPPRAFAAPAPQRPAHVHAALSQTACPLTLCAGLSIAAAAPGAVFAASTSVAVRRIDTIDSSAARRTRFAGSERASVVAAGDRR